MSTTQMKNNKEDTILEEEENGFYCFHCKKELHEKPWIIVDYPWTAMDYAWIIVDSAWIIVDYVWIIMDCAWIIVDYATLFFG